MPTDYAQSLADPLRHQMEAIRHLLDRDGGFDPSRSDQVFRIAGIDFFGDTLMPRLARVLDQRAPGVRIQLIDLVADDYVATLERYRVDVALVPPVPLPHFVERQPLFHSSFVMIARRGHPALAQAGCRPGGPVSLDLFCDLGHILMSQEGRLESLTDAALAKIGRKRRVRMSQPFFSGIARTVAVSDMVSMVPRQLAATLSSIANVDSYLAPIGLPMPVPLISMIWLNRLTSSSAHAWLRRTIAEATADLNEGEPPLPDP